VVKKILKYHLRLEKMCSFVSLSWLELFLYFATFCSFQIIVPSFVILSVNGFKLKVRMQGKKRQKKA